MRKLLFILLLLPAIAWGQSVTPQWRADAFGIGYTYIGLGHQDTMWNAAKIRSYVAAKYTASNGITLASSVFRLGGTLTANTAISSNFLFAVGDFTNFNSLLYVSPSEKIFQGYAGDGTFRSNIALSSISGGAFYIAVTDQIATKEISIQGDLTNGIVIQDGKFNMGLTHDNTVNHATWGNSTYVDKKYVDSVAAIGNISPDSVLHPNKNLYELANKATARINIGLNGVHFPGYGLSGSNYNATANQTWAVDTTGSTGIVSKARATANYAKLWGSQTIAGATTMSSTLTTANIVPTTTNTSTIGTTTNVYGQVNARAFQSDAGIIINAINSNSISVQQGGVSQLAISLGKNILIGAAATDVSGKLQVNGRIRVTQGLVGAIGTDSLVVHDNTSKELKLVSPTSQTDGLIDNVLIKSANYTILAGDFVAGKKRTLDLYVDATAGAVVITMPSAVTFAGYEIYITKTDLSINSVTVNTVLGLNTLTTQYQSRHFMSNATSWFNH